MREMHESRDRNPTVSVVIPAYNTASYIAETLDSVFGQTFKDYEVIVVNDGSPDTPEFETALAPYQDRLIYLKQENRGPGAARNLGIRRARGEFVAFLDGDDVWEPTYLERQLGMFRERPFLDLVYCDTRYFGGSPAVGKTFMEQHSLAAEVTFQTLVPHQCGMLTSCVLARKRAVVEAGLFGERFLRAEDRDLWLRLAHRGGKLAYQRVVLARRRIHPGGLTVHRARMNEDEVGVLKNLLRELPLNDSDKALVQDEIMKQETEILIAEGKRHVIAGDHKGAAGCFDKSRELLRRTRLERKGTGSMRFLRMREGKLLASTLALRALPTLALTCLRRLG